MKMHEEEKFIDGKIIKVRVMDIGGYSIVKRGRCVKIVSLNDEWDDDVINPEFLIQQLKDAGIEADVFTFVQRLPESAPKFEYKMEWESVAALQITSYDNWYKGQLHPNVRNKIKKAKKKGVLVEICKFDDCLVEGIWRISNETPIRQGRPFPYYGVDRNTIRTAYASYADRSIFLGAYLRNELIGFIKLTYTDRYVRTLGLLTMIRHIDKAPMNALFDSAVKHCAENGVQFLVYGQYTYGKLGSETLRDFKKYNGFESIIIPRYYVSLSFKGSLYLKTNLHKGLSGILPNQIIRQLREVRNWWYEDGIFRKGGILSD